MIHTYLKQNGQISKSSNVILSDLTIWIDLIEMTVKEENLIESTLKINIPNREEVAQIEISNKLYTENEALYISLLVTNDDQEIAPNDSITFILYNNKLLTIRYSKLSKPFNYFISNLEKIHTEYTDAKLMFLGIFSILIERLADILQEIKHKIDKINNEIFSTDYQHSNKEKINHLDILKKIGRYGNLISKNQESLLSFSRAINYTKKSVEFNHNEQYFNKLDTMLADIHSLNEHADSMSTETTFLLEATLGMINIEQSNIIRLVSVVSLVFLPPTLIASIYGMNFEWMPELEYKIGYPIVLFVMLISGWLPYKFCKKKRWL